jgi:ferritin-like metal-binding protein YciE
LQEAFEEHLRQTNEHISRLEQVFELLEMPARGKKCTGMQNLIKEGNDMIAEVEDDATRDAVMIAAAQKVEHYEIASYGTVRTWANLLGKTDVAAMLEDTLEEEKDTDQRLTAIAEAFVNEQAADEDDDAADKDRPARAGRRASMGRSPRHTRCRPGRSRRQRTQALKYDGMNPEVIGTSGPLWQCSALERFQKRQRRSRCRHASTMSTSRAETAGP